MERTLILLFLFGAVFFSCKNAPKSEGGTANGNAASGLDKDFPVVEGLKFESFNKFKISQEIGGSVVDGNVLWHFEEGEDNFGCCYDLNTGNQLSVIASRGDAANELTSVEWFNMTGDSVAFCQEDGVVKTFAKKDIVEDVPMGDRKCSTWKAPDDVLVFQTVKLPGGAVFATIRPAVFKFEKAKANADREETIAVFGAGTPRMYETINYDSFDLSRGGRDELPAKDLLRWTYAQGCVAAKDDNMVALSASDQFILYTFDVNTGKVVNEKRYSEVERDGGKMSFRTTNENKLSVMDIKVNDRYIVCEVDGYLTSGDKETKKMGKALFVFDWNLKPVKRYDLPVRVDGYYRVANDCSAVYFCKQHSRYGLTLYKADLNI